MFKDAGEILLTHKFVNTLNYDTRKELLEKDTIEIKKKYGCSIAGISVHGSKVRALFYTGSQVSCVFENFDDEKISFL